MPSKTTGHLAGVRASEGMLVAASRSPGDRLKPLSPHGVVGIINRPPREPRHQNDSEGFRSA